MRTVWVGLALLILVPVLSGCKALLYTPSTHVVPMFERSGQVQAAVSLKQDAGFDVQVAGSPLPHIVLFTTGTAALNVLDRYQQRYGELGGGFYAVIPYEMTLELLAGKGRGRARGQGEQLVSSDDIFPVIESYSYEAAYRRTFAQVNIGKRTDGGALLVGGALRFSWVHFDDFETDPEDLVREVRAVYAEPALFFRARVNRFVDLEGQLGSSYALREEEQALFGKVERYGSVGIRLHLGRPSI
ncbi:MAG: hypothetical protein ABJF88_10100 [Rhodothermales bacterium]